MTMQAEAIAAITLHLFSLEYGKYSSNYFAFAFCFTMVGDWLSSLIGKLLL